MIDNPARTARLVAALKAAAPFEVELVPSLVQYLREQHIAIADKTRHVVSDLSYAGDEGGIVCHIAPADKQEALVVSLTQVRVPRSMPLAAAVADYHNHRVKKLKKQKYAWAKSGSALLNHVFRADQNPGERRGGRTKGTLNKTTIERLRQAGIIEPIAKEIEQPTSVTAVAPATNGRKLARDARGCDDYVPKPTAHGNCWRKFANTCSVMLSVDCCSAESEIGPKRHFAAPNNNVAIGVTTDIDRHGYWMHRSWMTVQRG
jgi:hypothetical protein